MWEGTVVSLHIAPEASAPMMCITEVRAFPGRGLEGDRYFTGTGFYSRKLSYGGREVTLVEIGASRHSFAECSTPTGSGWVSSSPPPKLAATLRHPVFR